jgi:hypothetical protein
MVSPQLTAPSPVVPAWLATTAKPMRMPATTASPKRVVAAMA